ncbi:phage tail tape measure protein [Flavobacterium nitratireducens]|uniref:phage tail tape measure protein n=1 Tax=Flavobacterium nitratireducens TaxID=992289 RepID=UPI0024156174|nr:phage tail tape measure protein [Flavobacterium nitratireducens]
MAKTISDEVMKFSIVINGNEGQKALFDLEKATRKLNEENKALGLQKKLLEKQGKQETEAYKNLTATIKANSAEITANKAKMKTLQDQIGITGLTMGQLQAKSTMLRNTLRNLVPGSADYKKYEADLNQVKARMNELSGKAKETKLSLGSMADGFNRYQGMALSVIATLTGVVYSIQKIIDINGKLAGAQSNVMKTTGMTRKEVDELAKSFGLLHTRTSRINLLGIAEQGGRIGIAKEEIGQFVDVMNKASVALGDSFTGGAEEVANKLGKIKFLFEETKDLGVEQSYNSIGSAINDLGAKGVASEANIADFTTRLGSLTDVLKPTIQETLALGAAFEESGLESEVSARAYGIFMKQASTESGKFAKVMGISQKAVENMVNTNPLEFMLKFSEGMKGMDATDVAKTLDYLGISADGANKVIGAMGNNTARFRELIDLSNKSFADGTSLINEYNIKNNDLEAILERISKTVSGWFSSETFIKWLTIGVNVLGKFIGATEDADNTVGKWADRIMILIKMLAIGITTIFSYQTGLKLVAFWTTKSAEATALSNIVFKIQYFWLVAQEVATKALAFTQSFLTFKIVEVRKAYVALMAAMSLNPWGALVAIIGACAAAYVAFSESTVETNKSLDNQILINQKISDQIGEQKQEVTDLVSIMKDENATIEQKKQALSQLQKIAGGYLDTLTQENIATAEGERLIRRYIAAIDELANAQAIQDVKAELRKEKLKRDNKVLALSLEKNSTKNEGSSWAGDDGKWFGLGGRNKMEIQAEIEQAKREAEDTGFQLTALENTKTKQIENLQKAITDRKNKLNWTKKDSKEFNELTQEIKTDEKALNILIGLPSSSGPNSPNDSKYKPLTKDDENGTKNKKDPNSTQEEINRLKLESTANYNEKLLKLTRQLEDDKIAAMQEGYQKELLIENQRYQREIDDLDRQKIHTEELAKLDEDIAKAKVDKDLKKYNALLTIRKGWDEKNAVLDDKINQIKEGKLAIHNLKLATIEEKAATEAINKKKEAFEREKQQREIKFNEELAALGNNKRAKAKLTEAHEEDELKRQEEFLRDLLNDYKKIVGKENFQGIDLSLLTPEQVKQFEDYAGQVGISLTELINKINELKGNKQNANAEALGVGGGQADIFGFTPDNWVTLFDNLEQGKLGINEMVFAVSALTNAYGMYSKFLEVNEKKQLATFERNTNTKKARYKQQLDSGRITQEQYNSFVEKADNDLAKKKAEIENKQAKRQKAITISQIAMNTAMAIMGIWAQFPKFDFGATAAIMSGVVGALGLAQIAMVAKQPLPSASGYEDGLYPEYIKREQDGKVFKSKYAGKTRSGLVKDTSHFLVAENGPEMVIDNKAWTKMNPAVKDALVNELRGIKGFEQGYYNENLKRYEVPAGSTATPSNSTDAELLKMVLAIVQDNTEVMREIKQYGIEAFMTNKDFKSMKNIREGLKKYDALKNNNKVS